MKKLVCFFSLFWVVQLTATAQEYVWSHLMGGSFIERGFTVDVDNNDHIISAGIITSASDLDPGIGVDVYSPSGQVGMYVQKLNEDGSLIWNKFWNVSSDIMPKKVLVDKDNNILLVGSYEGTADFDPGAGNASLTSRGNSDLFFLKLDPNGNFLWVREVKCSAVAVYMDAIIDNSGALYVSGNTEGITDVDPSSNVDDVSGYCAFMFKLNNNGNKMWHFALCSENFTNGSVRYKTLALNPVDSTIIAIGRNLGETDLDPGPGTQIYNRDVHGKWFAQKFNLYGELENVYVKNVGNLGEIKCKIDKYGHVICTGVFYGEVDFDFGDNEFLLNSLGFTDTYVLKMDAAFNFMWAVRMGDDAGDTPQDLELDKYGNLYISGTFADRVDFDPHPTDFYYISANTTYLNGFLWKLTAQGKFVWAHSTAENAYDSQAPDLVLDSKDHVICTGRIYGKADLNPEENQSTGVISTGEDDIFILKWLDKCTQITTSSIDTTVCQYLVLPNGRDTAFVEGQYLDTIANQYGCDSIMTINLSLTTIDNSTTASGDSLMANQASATYQWVNCTTGLDIDGATNQSFRPIVTGQYSVVITYLGCVTTSACEDFGVGINESQLSHDINLYPNPSSGIIHLNSENKVEKIAIHDLQGRVLLTIDKPTNNQPIDLSHLTRGCYVVIVRTNNSLTSQKVLLH
jgi:hypothetical protein